MKIIDILNLLKTNKSITILTINKMECKILYDRIKLTVSEDIKLIDKHTIQIKDSIINFVTPDTIKIYDPYSLFIVEFPDDIPKSILKSIKTIDVIYSHVEIV